MELHLPPKSGVVSAPLPGTGPGQTLTSLRLLGANSRTWLPWGPALGRFWSPGSLCRLAGLGEPGQRPGQHRLFPGRADMAGQCAGGAALQDCPSWAPGPSLLCTQSPGLHPLVCLVFNSWFLLRVSLCFWVSPHLCAPSHPAPHSSFSTCVSLLEGQRERLPRSTCSVVCPCGRLTPWALPPLTCHPAFSDSTLHSPHLENLPDSQALG